jgi:hypothetical protein
MVRTRGTEVSRAQVLAYRAQVQDLERPVGELSSAAVLRAGVQDYVMGRSAQLSLWARAAGTLPDPAIAAVHSVRGAMHLHRADDLDLYAAAVRFDDGADLAVSSFGPFGAELAAQGIGFADALDGVAAAMRSVMADGVARTKGELSGAVTPAVDPRVAPWCEGCGVHHVHDALFRYATLQAGLRIEVESPKLFRFLPPTGARDAPGGALDPAASRSELVHRFLRLAGPATHAQVAAWLGIAPGAARREWQRVADDLVAVDVDGWGASLRADDLDAVLTAPAPEAVRVLPPYDPVVGLGAREFLVPDKERRREVWRAVANPGVLLVRGEITGTCRLRHSRDGITLKVTAWRALTGPERRAVEVEAAALARHFGVPGAEVGYEPP